MSGKSYLVVGAGISGATIARLAAGKEPGSRITVIDCRDHIAGNCYDHIEDGIDVHDYGSHILHTDDAEVWHFLSHFSDFNTYMHRVKAVVEGIEVPVPFNLDSVRICFPPSLAGEIEKKLLKTYDFGARIPVSELMKTNDPDLKRLAQYVYENIYVHYTAKQWGKDPSELDSAVTARVPVVISRDPRYFRDRYQGIPVGAFNDTRRGTVLGGYAAMVRNMLETPNIEVRLETPFDPDTAEEYDRIFYTGPADELMDYEFGRAPPPPPPPPLPLGALRVRVPYARALPRQRRRELSEQLRFHPHP
jgi:UDP-galactopyranose mutase